MTQTNYAQLNRSSRSLVAYSLGPEPKKKYSKEKQAGAIWNIFDS